MRYGNFEDFFCKATGFGPYPYQSKISDMDRIPDILNIPTGAGKTEAAVLGIYLWRTVGAGKGTSKNIPKRLVYCLPMRTLVEQTVRRIRTWLERLGLENEIRVVTMMGGNVNSDYKLHPQKAAIIVGTQDMLLSRALNRGYAASQFQWPVEFGLLNNDCLWIMDEIQLMHNGLATSVQLESFRGKIGTYGPHKTVWMSATVNPRWLDTADFDSGDCTSMELGEEDWKDERLSKRNNACKKIITMNAGISRDRYDKESVEEMRKRHVDGTVTIIIVNTVKRAQNIFEQIRKTTEHDECILVHSRFRKNERRRINHSIEELSGSGQKNLIVVSTQVIEAGMDISARTMITELAPWPSLIQRFGRCNRDGRYEDSSIYVIDTGDNHAPYEKEDLDKAREELESADSASPSAIKPLDDQHVHEQVIRRPDVMELFDTNADLAGGHTDISRYVRSLEESRDVSVIWRDWDRKGRPGTERIQDDEICNVPIGDIKRLDPSIKIRTYDYREKSWSVVRAGSVRPGQILLIHCSDGRYTNDVGWNPGSKQQVDYIRKSIPNGVSEDEDSHDDDLLSYTKKWVTLNDHTVHVVNETDNILKDMWLPDRLEKIMLDAARYHDVGKAHHVFQETMVSGTDERDIPRGEFWAKRGGRGRHGRMNYRHEAISALAFLSLNRDAKDRDLTAYLIASHHGKVRMSMRTIHRKGRYDDQHILGMSTDGESVPLFFHKGAQSKKSDENLITDSDVPQQVFIKPDIARMGDTDMGRSWMQITLDLLKQYGPFKLALLEAVMRAADSLASSKEANAG